MKTSGSGTLATIAEAMILPTPGTLASNLLVSLCAWAFENLSLERVDGGVDHLQLLGENLHDRVGCCRKRCVFLGHFDQLVGASDPLGGDEAELR